MANQNTPKNNSQKKESAEKSPRNSARALDLLFEQAFRDVVGTDKGQGKSDFEASPRKVQMFRGNMSKFFSDVRGQAYALRDNGGDYENVEDETIAEYDTINSRYQFQIAVRELDGMRKRFLNKALKLYGKKYPEIKNISGKIEDLTVSEMADLLASKKSFQEFIATTLGINPEHLGVDISEIQAIFPDLEQKDAFLYKELLKYLGGTNATIDSLPKHLLGSIFDVYQGDIPVLREIIERFGLSFSLKDCLEAGVIGDEDLQKMAEEYCGKEIWESFTQSMQDRYIANLKDDESVRLLPDEILDFENHVSDKKLEKVIKNVLDDEVNFLIEENGKDPILADVTPDVQNGKWLWHKPWMEKMEKLFQKKGIHIAGFEKLAGGAVLSFLDPKDGKTVHTIRIDAIDIEIDSVDSGIEYTILTAADGGVWTGSNEKQKVSYSDFGKMLLHMNGAQVFSATEFSGKISTDLAEATKQANLLSAKDHEKIHDIGSASEKLTKEKFLEEIDLLDPDGAKIPFEKGMTFISKSGEDGYSGKEFSYTIQDFDTDILIKGENGAIPFEVFLETARSQTFRRIGKVGNDADFLHALGGFGVDADHTTIKDGHLVVEEGGHGHDTHGHNDHGHGHGHAKNSPTHYDYFTSESGGHIKIFEIKNGRVFFGEWKGDEDLDKTRKKYSAGELGGDKIEKLYEIGPGMSYAFFIEFLRKNRFNATKENLLEDPDAGYHGAHLHMEETWLKRWMKKPSLGDIFHGIEGLIHAGQHYFEKGSKLNGSRSALWLAKKFGLPADILAQLQADEIANMKGIITKIKDDKLKGLNGPVARKKALHIAHMKGSRPEEIAAAALYMVESYGHLYAEDIAYAQGSESFINALIYSCGYTSEAAIHEQKVKARIKFRADTGTEEGGQITEEEMIWGFLKGIDGNAESNPLAGALVKAMGGPSGWERAWRTEGTKNAIDKGARQTGDIPNAQGRMNKYLSALATHEFHTAYGMMKNIPSKDPAPIMQGAPIVWALCGMTQYASTKLVQDNLWQFVASQGHSFHAYSFLRNKPKNDLYRDVFLAAMEGIADQKDIDSLKTSINAVQYDGHRGQDDEFAKKQLKNFQNINNIWRKYCNRGLHDRLQGNDSWMVDQIHTHHNKQVGEYFGYMGGVTHSMMSMENPPSDNNGWEYQFGYKDSMIVHKTEDNLMSFEWQINKIPKAGSTNFALNKDKFIRFWPPIVDAFEKLKNGPLPEDIKRRQYFQFRKDVVKHFRTLLNSFYSHGNMENVLGRLRATEYSRDLLKMGITLEEIFTQEYSINDGIAEDDYHAWKNGGRIPNIQSETQAVQQKTGELLASMQNDALWAKEKVQKITGQNNTYTEDDSFEFAE